MSYLKYLLISIVIQVSFQYAKEESSKKDSTFICDFNNCPLGQGTCFENECVCSIGFVSIRKSEYQCSYEVKDHSVAFFLEFFLPFGTGHFYTQRLFFGFIKLILASFICIFWCGDICGLRIRFSLNSKWDKIHIGLVLINLIVFVGMHLFDLVCFGFNIYLDGNGIEMI